MRSGFPLRRAAYLSLSVVVSIAAVWPARARIMTQEERRAYEQEQQRVLAIQKQSNNVAYTNDAATIARLQGLVLPGVRWPNLDVRLVLSYLEAHSKELDPRHPAIRFVLKVPDSPDHPDILGRTIQRRVCIVLPEKQPFMKLLMDISNATNLAFVVNKDEVTFLPWQPDAFISLDPYSDM